jgi:hypothetical protein
MPPDDPIVELLRTTETLDRDLRARILALGPAAIPELIDILTDDDTGEDDPGQGWPPIHAVDLLVDLQATEAVEPLLDLLVETDFIHTIHDRILQRLPQLGAPVLEPALARLQLATDEDVFGSLCSILAQLQVKDERIFQALCDEFAENVVAGAIDFSDYGDRRALPMLAKEIFGFVVDWNDAHGILGLDDLVESYGIIAGTLPDHLQAHVEDLWTRWDAHVRERAAEKAGKKR